MKIFKNYSVVNYPDILGLALTLLFLSSCGKKENADEIKTNAPSGEMFSFDMKSKIRPRHARGAKAKSKISRKSAGVLITAELISENKITPKNLFAEIITKNNKKFPAVSIASSTNYNDGQITFPGIKKGLTNLQIVVKADNIAETSSELFDTLNGKNKTIEIKIEQGVVWQGNVKYADGTPVTNFYLRATPRGLYENQKNIGHINKKIPADKDGDFKITGLLNEHYKLHLFTENAEQIATNVYFCDQINFINFVFPAVEFYNLHGIVLYEKNNEPAEGIKITCKNVSGITLKTDVKGEFKIKIPKGKYYNEHLKIDEPGFAVVNRGIDFNFADEKIVLYLREVGSVEGKITTPDGKPISGIKVKLLPIYKWSKKHKAKYVSRNYYNSIEENAYSVKAIKPSDNEGNYSVTRVAAPETCTINIEFCDYFFPNTGKLRHLKVMPGKTTKRDIILLAKPTVMLKFLEKNGTPILKYRLDGETESSSYSYGCGAEVNLTNGEEWAKIRLGMAGETAMLSLIAKTEKGQFAETNGIVVTSVKTNFIVLTAIEVPKIIATGFIYNYEMKPIIDKDVWASLPQGGNASIGKSDHLGYFEIKNFGVKPGDEIQLRLNYLGNYYETNVPVGTTDIEWVLPEPRILVGRVCIENSNTPATNFGIGVGFVGNNDQFVSKNGEFKINMGNDYSDSGKIFAKVKGYSPKSVKYNFNGEKLCDVGNIILDGKPGIIKGRVIDDSGNPMSVRVSLILEKGDTYTGRMSIITAPEDGEFLFNNIPIATYKVTAYSKINNVSSKIFELKSGETKIIPDLIIVTTNSTIVNFEFLLPDGNPAGNADVKYFNKLTDENGELTERIRFGNYEDLEINLDGQTYYSEKFVINKNTTRITVQLKSPSKIIGTATIDGKSLNNVRLRLELNKHQYYATVFNGKFEFEGPEGLYSVFCRKEKCISEVKLTRNGTNRIKFKKGTGTFNIEFPEEMWSAYLMLKFGGTSFQIDNIDGGSKIKNAKSTNLPAGEYQIYARYYGEDISSNLTVSTVLKDDETKKIKF